MALALSTMSRPWRRPLPATLRKWYSSPYEVTVPRRPVVLYVDLRGLPDIMAAMSLPEAYTLTRDNIPNLMPEEEEAFLTYMNHFRFEDLNKTVSCILDAVYNHINRTWNSHLPNYSLRLSIVNQVGTNQDLRNMETLRQVLSSHRPGWPQEQDHELGPRSRHRDPTDPFFLRLRVFRSPQSLTT